MKTIVLLAVFIAAANSEVSFRISNGENARFGAVKCYTTLKIIFEDAVKTCGGCLISPTKVLTSGNCLTNLEEGTATEIKFAFGTSKVPKRGLGFNDISFATGYDPTTRNSTADLAIITLNKTVTESMFRKPATPSTNATADAYVGQKLYVCGFGNTDNERNKPHTLQCTYLKVIKSAECIPAAAAATTAASGSSAAGSSAAGSSAAGSSAADSSAAGSSAALSSAAGSSAAASSDAASSAAASSAAASSAAGSTAGRAALSSDSSSATTAATSGSAGIICTRNVNDANVCHGDEGSPVFSKNGDTMVFVGIVSYFPDVRPNARCQDGHKVVITQLGAYSTFLSS